MDRKKSGKISWGKIIQGKIAGGKIFSGKRAALLLALCLAFSGCASQGRDSSGQGDAVSAAAGFGTESGRAGAEARDGAGAPGDDLKVVAPDSASSASEGVVPGEGDYAGTGLSGEGAWGTTVIQTESGSPVRESVEPEASTGRGGSDSSAGQGNGSASSDKQGMEEGLASGQDGVSASASEPDSEKDNGYDFTVCFAGDINLDENWGTTQFLDTQENGIYDCISAELTEVMQSADIMCLNNEFTYSTGGSPLPGKAYTFRAMPERVEILHQLGVDAVTLANNHVYDYGKEALLDTFAVLEEAKVPYFGAGRTLEDAMKPLYLEADGKRIALVGASRAEKNKMTPQATETEPGILRCYDTELYRQAIREGKENADFCIAFVHWGTEYSFDLEKVQMETGKEYLDVGADAVIGAHSHCLQGMEYYNGKPIIYSLGNYWFNEKTLDTMLLQLHFTGTGEQGQLEVQVIPAVQAGYRTTYAAEAEEQRRIYDFLESISVNVEISDEGIVRES